MNKTLAIVFGLMLLLVGVAHAVPGTIDSVRIDGDDVSVTDDNYLSLERGQDFEVRVRVTADAPIANAEVVAFISGFDFSRDEDRISDSSGVFDMSAQNTVIKRLNLQIPDRADKDEYRLRVIFSDRDGEEVVQNYRIKITPPRHSVTIRDVILNPSTEVEAGRSLLASVRMKNIGDKSEDDVKVTVSIPELGLSASDFVKEIDEDESASSEDIFFRIPACAKAGTYTVQIELEYDDGYRSVAAEQDIDVKASALCESEEGSSVASNIMAISPDRQDVERGTGGGVFTLTFSNPTRAAKSYIMDVQAPEGISVRFSPSSAILMEAGDTQNAFMYVAASDDAALGTQFLTVNVKDTAGKILRTQAVRVNVMEGEKQSGNDFSFDFGGDGIVNMLVIGLVVLLVVLLLVGGYLLSNNQQQGKQPPKSLNKTYY